MSELRPRRRVPLYVPCCVAGMVAAQLLCYYATRLALPHLTARVMTGALDARIPFSPPWVVVYFLAFAFWLGTGLWFLPEDKSRAYRFTAAYFLAMALSAVVFLARPGTMERPEIVGSGFFEDWMRLVYRVDTPTNLCPSLHVLITWLCWRGTWGSRRIPGWYKVFSFVFVLCVCCAVLLVKQHALIDVPCGLLVGELSLQLARALRLERVLFALERWSFRLIHHERE